MHVLVSSPVSLEPSLTTHRESSLSCCCEERCTAWHPTLEIQDERVAAGETATWRGEQPRAPWTPLPREQATKSPRFQRIVFLAEDLPRQLPGRFFASEGRSPRNATASASSGEYCQDRANLRCRPPYIGWSARRWSAFNSPGSNCCSYRRMICVRPIIKRLLEELTSGHPSSTSSPGVSRGTMEGMLRQSSGDPQAICSRTPTLPLLVS
jgi:hypothetical protein